MKEQIERCIEYLKSISLKELMDFRVEEIEGQRIVLSFREKVAYYKEFELENSQRIYKEFEWENSQGKIISMRQYPTPPKILFG